MTERTAAQFVIAELRRQVDHQITAATSIDTKAAGLIAATFALFALVVPRLVVETAAQLVIGVFTLGLIVATLANLALAIKPRVQRFSYGPDDNELLAFVTDKDPIDVLETAAAGAYVEVRSMNETEIQSKSRSLTTGIVFLILTVVGLGAMVVAGGVQ